MIRRPPRSTPFPTRRSSDLMLFALRLSHAAGDRLFGGRVLAAMCHQALHLGNVREGLALGRSEEHTSELQSRQYLVCRLLLEKKKNHYFSQYQYAVKTTTYT